MRRRRPRSRPPCYFAWMDMRKLCGLVRGKTPRQLSYYVGVNVCAEWLDYKTFELWAMAHGWARGLTLTRRDKNGDFCPENCFWCSRGEANNYHRCVRRLPDGRSARDLLGTRNLGRDGVEQVRLAGRLFGWSRHEASRWDVESAVVAPPCRSRYTAARVRAELARTREISKTQEGVTV